MTKLRDFLIVLVLGCVVLAVAIHFFSGVNDSYVSLSPVIGEAEMACQEDNMLCHVGRDSFPSVESAQAYLNSPEHLAHVRERKLESDLKAEEEALAGAGPEAVREACRKLHTISCKGIDAASVGLFANLVIQEKNRLRRAAEGDTRVRD